MKKWLCILVLLPLLVSGQAPERADRPRIGLVLSGGGAKGMAHIGVLKVLEEAGVEIDYIGGTSMGAIIGGLYASGYTATELDSIFMATDFSNLIQDNLPRSAKTFYEKDDTERYALTLPFSGFRISFPQAISGGQKIYNELVRVLYHVKDTRDFSDLPIPFFCIATDVETGEEVLLESGYLPQAIMASGTFPSLFEPAVIDDRILIDGGVLNNYPVDELKERGADIVIGVDVQHGLRDRESLMSATDVLLQINNYRTLGAMEKKVGKTDIYIKPDIENFSVISFDRKQTIIERGEVAAREQLEKLRELARPATSLRPEIDPAQPTDTLLVNRLLLQGMENYSRGYVKGKLRFDLSSPTTFNRLQQGITNLAATGNFQTIRYKLLDNGLGQDLVMDLRERPNEFFLRLSAHYDDLYKSAALINLTKKRFLLKDDVASFDLILGDNIRYNLQYYIDKGFYWSFGINSRLSEFSREIELDVFRSNFQVPAGIQVNNFNLDVFDITNQAYVQTVLQEEFAFSLGVEHQFLKYSTLTLNLGEGTDPESRTLFEKSHYFSTYGKLTLDTYDDIYFPKRGLFFDGDFHLYLFSTDFNDNFKEFSIAKARMGAALPLTDKLAVNVETEGGFKLGTSNVTTYDFVLGGYGAQLINNFTPFFGYDYLSLVGNSYVKAMARVDYEIFPDNHILMVGNMANVEDDIFRTGEWFTAPDYTGFGLGYGLESFIGPIQVFYSWSPENKQSGRFFISVGYWF